MVTLAERISKSVLRRSRRLPGSPCTLATQDATAVKSLHRDHLSRFYPQGSTAIPACATNYPGAAAQPHPPASAKCRPASGASSRLYINGANTYQFVMSSPVGSVDPLGLWHWYEPWTWPIWHSTPVKVCKDTAKNVLPGGEFCEGAEALGQLAHVGPFVTACEQYDLTHGINPFTDPLYEGLKGISNGHSLNTLPPAEQKAIHDWVKRAGY